MEIRIIKYIISFVLIFYVLDVDSKLIEGSYWGTDDSGGSCSLTIIEDSFDEDTSRETYRIGSGYMNSLIKGTFPAQFRDREGGMAIDWNEVEGVYQIDDSERIIINIFLENAVPTTFHFERKYLDRIEKRKCRFLELR